MVKTKSKSSLNKDIIREGNVEFEYISQDTEFAELYEEWEENQKKKVISNTVSGGTQLDFFEKHLTSAVMRKGSKNRRNKPKGVKNTRSVLKKIRRIFKRRQIPTEEEIEELIQMGKDIKSWENVGKGDSDFALDPALIMFTNRERKAVKSKGGKKRFKSVQAGKVYGHYRTKEYVATRPNVSEVKYINNPKQNPLHLALFGTDANDKTSLSYILRNAGESLKKQRVRITVYGKAKHIGSFEKVASEMYKIGSVKEFLGKLVKSKTFFRVNTGQLMLSKVKVAIDREVFPIKTKREKKIVENLIYANPKEKKAGDIVEFRYNSQGAVALLALVHLAIKDFLEPVEKKLDGGGTFTAYRSQHDYFVWSKGASNAFDYRPTKQQREKIIGADGYKKPKDRKYSGNTRSGGARVSFKKQWRDILKGV